MSGAGFGCRHAKHEAEPVNLAGAAWLSLRFLKGRVAFHRLERWQTAYLPVFAIWAAAVVVLLPPLFSFE